MSNADIAMRSGLSRATVCKISKLRVWDNVKLRTIEAFAFGCGVNLMAPHKRRDNRLVHRGKMEFMKRGSPAQKRMYRRLIGDLSKPSYVDLGRGPRDAHGLLE